MIIQTTTQEVVCRIFVDDIFGRKLRGFVEISTPGEVIINYAFIEISGIAYCEFALEKNEFKFPRYFKRGTFAFGHQIFYYTRHNICGGNASHKHKGVKNYKFSCGWPTRLPGTWLGEFGSIKYWGKVTLIEGCNIYVHNREIIVRSRRDLSSEQHLKFESQIKIHKPLHFLDYFGYIKIDVWIPFSGVAINQCIPVLCSIDNHSNAYFGSIIFVLTRIDLYRATNPITITKSVRTDICRIPKMVDITSGKTNCYCILEIDEVLPTNQFKNCCCQIIYELWVSVQGLVPPFGPYGMSQIHTPSLPIIIGTDPLYNFEISELAENLILGRN